MTTPTLPICAKLRDWPAVGDGTDALAAGTVSAMMIEAADTIEALVEALEGCEAYFEALEETGDEKHPAMLKLIRGPLTLAREGAPHDKQ